MEHTQQDRTLALAGIYQSAKLVQEIARTGSVSDANLSALLETLFRFDANSVLEVYGDSSTVKKGLQVLADQLSGKRQQSDMELTRYAIGLLQLEKSLSGKPSVMDELARQLQTTQDKMEYFDLTHENIIASLAEIYQQYVSPLAAKIMVKGEGDYLSQAYNANKIRAILLAGIRSAVLWRQCGGTRWQLLFSRKRYLQSAEELLRTI
jgi:high frequency lysogenization protein